MNFPAVLLINLSGVLVAFVMGADHPEQLLALIVTTISGFIATFLQQHYAEKRAERNREWHTQQRIAEAQVLRLQTERDAAALKLLLAENTALTHAVQKDVSRVVTETNGKMDKLLAVTAEAERAKGILEGRDQVKAEEFGLPPRP